MIIAGGARGEQLCWSEPWMRFSARTPKVPELAAIGSKDNSDQTIYGKPRALLAGGLRRVVRIQALGPATGALLSDTAFGATVR